MEDIKSCRVHWFYGEAETDKKQAIKKLLHDKVIKGEGKHDVAVITTAHIICFMWYANNPYTDIIIFDNDIFKNEYTMFRNIKKFIRFIDNTTEPKDIYITTSYKPEEVYKKYNTNKDRGFIEIINNITELREFKN